MTQSGGAAGQGGPPALDGSPELIRALAGADRAARAGGRLIIVNRDPHSVR